ncbi:MAG TPA: alpha/beta hydrolase [Herpetosiphonaceae bacterium]
MTRSLIYCHGFASGPETSKGRWLAGRLAALGLELRLPDLNQPSFARLTMSAMIGRALAEVRACPPGPVGLIGSSMGGAVALHLAACYGRREARAVDRLLLLAPSLDFIATRRAAMGDEGLERWRQMGQAVFYNYQRRRPQPVHYGLIEDLRQYDAWGTAIDLPIRIIHGLRDDSVPAAQSRRFAASRPNVALTLVDSEHELLDQLELIWAAAVEWFALG